MAKILHVTVSNRVAEYSQRAGFIVCGNSDYVVQFVFDPEWDDATIKTARFKYNGTVADVVFSGDTVAVPKIRNATALTVGVFAGDLKTTTPATIPAVKSILCEDGVPPDPEPDVYPQLMEILNNGALMPEIKDEDEGKVLRAVNGVWSADNLGAADVGAADIAHEHVYLKLKNRKFILDDADLLPGHYGIVLSEPTENHYGIYMDSMVYHAEVGALEGRWVKLNGQIGYIGANTPDAMILYTDSTMTTPLYVTCAAGDVLYPVQMDVTEEIKEILDVEGSGTIPTFDLVELGMGPITIIDEGEPVVLETDTTEIMEAVERGEAGFTLEFAYSGLTVQGTYVMQAQPGGFAKITTIPFAADYPFVVTLLVEEGKITGTATTIQKMLPDPTADDEGKVLTAEGGEWVLKEIETELPEIADGDEGKVLTAEGGEWVLKEIETELPEIADGDEGKVLTVEGGEWVLKEQEGLLPEVTADDDGKVLAVEGGEWTAKEQEAILPEVTSDDDGKVLAVENGEWVAKELTTEDEEGSDTAIPTFDLVTMGLPAVPFDGTSVAAYDLDTSEIFTALEAGTVQVLVSIGELTSRSFFVDGVKMLSSVCYCSEVFTDGGETYVLNLSIWKDAIIAQIHNVLTELPEEPAAYDLSAFDTDGTITETYADGTTKTTTMEFDEDGNPVKITDGDGNVVTLTW